jgi:hypothetical protein
VLGAMRIRFCKEAGEWFDRRQWGTDAEASRRVGTYEREPGNNMAVAVDGVLVGVYSEDVSSPDG